MTRSDARRQLSWLTEQFGRDGVLVVPKGRRAEEPMLPEDAVHRWPPCRCGAVVVSGLPAAGGGRSFVTPDRTRPCALWGATLR